jgi:hypothetical protein
VILAIALWAVVVVTVALFVVWLFERRRRDLKSRAHLEILHERGVELQPDEPMKSALLRARRKESMSPGPVERRPEYFEGTRRSRGTRSGEHRSAPGARKR